MASNSDKHTSSAQSTFGLSASDGGAFAAYNDGHEKKAEKDESSKKPDGGDPSAKHVVSPALSKTRDEAQHRISPGTLLLAIGLHAQTMKGDTPPAQTSVRSVRALTFDTLSSHRSSNNGEVSPSPAEQIRSTSVASPNQQPHCIPPTMSSKQPSVDRFEVELSPSSRDPPVAEIRIPTPHEGCKNERDDVDSTNDHDYDYKSLFLCCQHELQTVKDQAAATAEENRLLKRNLIQLQKQLNSYRRNKRGPSASWSIPVSNQAKRHQQSLPTPILEAK